MRLVLYPSGHITNPNSDNPFSDTLIQTKIIFRQNHRRNGKSTSLSLRRYTGLRVCGANPGLRDHRTGIDMYTQAPSRLLLLFIKY